MDWQKKYSSKLVSAQEAVRCIRSGDKVVIQQAHATSYYLLDALKERADAGEVEDVTFMSHILWEEPWFSKPAYADRFHYLSNFLDRGTRPACREGRGEYIPAFYHDMARYYRQINPPDVFIAMLTPPDKDGFCSYGLNADYSVASAESAKLIIAQINRYLPRTSGARISMDKLDYVVEHDEPLVEMQMGRSGPVQEQIARHIVPFIQDGACLQLGIGSLPDTILSFIRDRRHLGIHSELLSDGVADLYYAGAVDNSRKNIDKGKFVVNFLIGTKKLFDFCDNNTDVLCLPVDYVNDPYVIGRNDNVISINSCLQVDLMGQVNADFINGQMYSGVGGQVDFIRGARISKGGLSFITLPSTALNGTVSRIVPRLDAPVTTSRYDVMYIVTEYGAVDLFGKTISQRAEALISIAHPDFREELAAQARAMKIL